MHTDQQSKSLSRTVRGVRAMTVGRDFESDGAMLPRDHRLLRMDGQYDRRAVIRRAMALGLAAPLVSAMMKAAPAAAQDASPAAAPSGEPIKIGSPYNLTGGYASLDNPAANGSKLAVKEINAAGGVLGRPLQIFIEDGRSDVPTITSVAKKLV